MYALYMYLFNINCIFEIILNNHVSSVYFVVLFTHIQNKLKLNIIDNHEIPLNIKKKHWEKYEEIKQLRKRTHWAFSAKYSANQYTGVPVSVTLRWTWADPKCKRKPEDYSQAHPRCPVVTKINLRGHTRMARETATTFLIFQETAATTTEEKTIVSGLE